MPTIKSENWDGVTAPAIPSGWTVDTPLVTATTNSPTSAPNSLVFPAASTDGLAPRHACWATVDTNGGNVQVSGTLRFASAAGTEQDVWLFARASAVASSASYGTLSCYEAGIGRNDASGLFLTKRVSGSNTTLGTVGPSAFADATNYRVTLSCVGSHLQVRCQRLSDGFWLNASGVFIADLSNQTVAISVTDTAIAAASGYSGVSFYLASSASGDAGVDDWLLETSRLPATFYVAPTGSDANSGTSSAAPWQTIAKVNSTALLPGDQVLFQGGQTFSGNLVLQSSGTAALPILVGTYGTGAATITPGTGTGIQVKDADYVRLSNLTVAGPGVSISGSTSSTTSTGTGLEVLSTQTQSTIASWRQSIYCDRISVAGTYWGIAVRAFGGSASGPYPVGYNDVRLTNCAVSECLGAGIMVYATNVATTLYSCIENGGAGNLTPYHKNVYLGSCTVRNVYGDSAYTSFYSGSGIDILNVAGALVERCLATNCGQACGGTTPGGGGPCAFISYASTGCTFQYCEASRQHNARGSDALGFDLDGGSRNCMVQYCYSHDNDGSGLVIYDGGGSGPTQNCTFRYTISQNDARTIDMPVRQGGGNPGCVFHNNVIYSATAGGSPYLLGNFVGAGVAFYNNIFWCGSGVGLCTNVTAPTLAGNLYWFAGGAFSVIYNALTYSSLSAFQAVQETVSGVPTGVFANPLLASGGAGGTLLPTTPVAALGAYDLGTGSPAIDAGLDLRALFGVDPGLIDLRGRPNRAGAAYDIGACEYGASALVGSGSGLRRVNLAGGIGG